MQNIIIQFDRRVAYAVQQLPDWLTPIMQAATFIGLPVVIIFLAAVIAVAAWLHGQRRIAYSQVASVMALGGNSVLKHLVHRTRPDTMYVAHMKIKSYSFPSGHAFGSVAFYGLLAYLAYRHLPQPWNIIVTFCLLLLIILIGTSRVYLGAHFPSDVLAGWLLGGLSLLIIIVLIRP